MKIARRFPAILCMFAIASGLLLFGAEKALAQTRPNILFCIADDWGWPHAGAYGDPVVQTPAFDRLSSEGVLFENAFVTAPSCTPCRNSILTGQWHWRLEEGGNLWSTLHPKFPVYPLLLEDAGYYVGHWRKAWGPGDWKTLGRKRGLGEPPESPEHHLARPACVAEAGTRCRARDRPDGVPSNPRQAPGPGIPG